MRRDRRGITLTELLTVISVIVILSSFLAPFLIRAQQQAQGRVCTSNLREIYQGLGFVANDNLGRLPRCIDTVNDLAGDPTVVSGVGSSVVYRYQGPMLADTWGPPGPPATTILPIDPAKVTSVTCQATTGRYSVNIKYDQGSRWLKLAFTEPGEGGWWYRKAAAKLYPWPKTTTVKIKKITMTFDASANRNGLVMLTSDLAPTADDTKDGKEVYNEWPGVDIGGVPEYPDILVAPDHDPTNAPLGFRPERSVFRCPASTDPPNSWYAPNLRNKCVNKTYYYAKVRGQANQNVDKDRVYDEQYGYNNAGFFYVFASSLPTRVLPDPNNQSEVPGGNLATTIMYHASSTGSDQRFAGTLYPGVTGKRPLATVTYTHIGAYAEVPESARTVLLADYVKADAKPFGTEPLAATNTEDLLYGYRFRHGGRGNFMFVDGHVGIYAVQNFLGGLGSRDKLTESPRIHWTVYKP